MQVVAHLTSLSKCLQLFCLCLCLLLPLVSHAYPATSSTAGDKSLSLEDTDLDNEQGESVKDSQIAKRSGSFDYVAHLKSGLLSSIGGASASIASGSSGGSSGGGETHHHEVVVHVSLTTILIEQLRLTQIFSLGQLGGL